MHIWCSSFGYCCSHNCSSIRCDCQNNPGQKLARPRESITMGLDVYHPVPYLGCGGHRYLSANYIVATESAMSCWRYSISAFTGTSSGHAHDTKFIRACSCRVSVLKSRGELWVHLFLSSCEPLCALDMFILIIM